MLPPEHPSAGGTDGWRLPIKNITASAEGKESRALGFFLIKERNSRSPDNCLSGQKLRAGLARQSPANRVVLQPTKDVISRRQESAADTEVTQKHKTV